MNPYRLSFYWTLQIGFLIGRNLSFLIIEIPFISIYINFEKDTKGIRWLW